MFPQGTIGVLFGCFARKIDGEPWSTWWFNHLPGPSAIYVSLKDTYARDWPTVRLDPQPCLDPEVHGGEGH